MESEGIVKKGRKSRPESAPESYIGERAVPPRLSCTLSSQMAKPRPLKSLVHDNSGTKNTMGSDVSYPQIYDKSGREVTLTPWEIEIAIALSSAIPFADKDVNSMIDLLDTMDDNGEIDTKDAYKRYSMHIDIIRLSKLILGDARLKSIIKVQNGLISLSEKELRQQLSVTVKGVKKECELVEPIISLGSRIYVFYDEARDKRGRKTKLDCAQKADDGKILRAVEVILSPLFLHKGATNYIQFDAQKLFEIFRTNHTDLYARLLNDLACKWTQHYRLYLHAEDKAKGTFIEHARNDAEKRYKNCADKSQRIKAFIKGKEKEFSANKAQLVKDEQNNLRHYREKITTIKERCSTDYDSNRALKKRLIDDLSRAIKDLIDVGIITDESKVSGEYIDVYFNFNYAKMIQRISPKITTDLDSWHNKCSDSESLCV